MRYSIVARYHFGGRSFLLLQGLRDRFNAFIETQVRFPTGITTAIVSGYEPRLLVDGIFAIPLVEVSLQRGLRPVGVIIPILIHTGNGAFHAMVHLPLPPFWFAASLSW